MEKATFGAGCFWGVEAAFQEVKGVHHTRVGYEGGTTSHPKYSDVCSGKTGHVEVIEIEFDPTEISYEELLATFWEIHDPTLLNRQGPDIGTQYRSIIFTHSLAQEKSAKDAKAAVAKRLLKPIMTEILPASSFYQAEDYHQQYIKKHHER